MELLETEKVTVTGGVPTIWMGMTALLDGRDLSALRTIICGGSAVPRALSETYRAKIGVPILQAWGMTETSPIASVCVERNEVCTADDDTRADVRASAGIVVPGVELRIVDTATGEVHR
jgi:fatty-acyl-CoA synthase